MRIRTIVAKETTLALPARELEGVVRLTLARVGSARWRSRREAVEVAFLAATPARIRRLNARYRRVDRATDVLSFPGAAGPIGREKKMPTLGKITPVSDQDGVVRLGEIVIAPAVARRGAAAFGHREREHLAYLVIHGLLHLCGYDHERSKRGEREMFRIQEDLFKRFKKA